MHRHEMIFKRGQPVTTRFIFPLLISLTFIFGGCDHEREVNRPHPNVTETLFEHHKKHPIPDEEITFLLNESGSGIPSKNEDASNTSETPWRPTTGFRPITIHAELNSPLGHSPYPEKITWQKLISVLTPDWNRYIIDNPYDSQAIVKAQAFTDLIQSFNWTEAKAYISRSSATDDPLEEEIRWQMDLLWSTAKLSHLNQLWPQLSSNLDIEKTLESGMQALTDSTRGYLDDPAILLNQTLFLRYSSEYKKTKARAMLLSGAHLSESDAELEDGILHIHEPDTPSYELLLKQSRDIDNTVLTYCRDLILYELDASDFRIREDSLANHRINIALYLIEDIVLANQSWTAYRDIINSIHLEMDHYESDDDFFEASTTTSIVLPANFYPTLISIWLKAPPIIDEDPNAKVETRDILRSRMLTYVPTSTPTLIAKARIAQADIYEFRTSAIQLYQRVLHREVDNLEATIELARHWLSVNQPNTARGQIDRYPSLSESRDLQLLLAHSFAQQGQIEDTIQLTNDLKEGAWTADQILDKAHLAAVTGQWMEAAQLLKYHLLRCPDNPEQIRKMTTLYVSVNQIDLAQETLLIIRELAGSSETRFVISDILSHLNAPDRDLDISARFLAAANNPKHINTSFNYLESLLLTGRLDEALSIINRQFSQFKDSPDAHLLAAEIYLLKNQPLLAMEEIKAAVSLKTKARDRRLHQTLSQLYGQNETPVSESASANHLTYLYEYMWQRFHSDDISRLSMLLLHHHANELKNENAVRLSLNLLLKHLPEVPQTYSFCLQRLSPFFDETDLIAKIRAQSASPLSQPLLAILELRRDNVTEAENLYWEGFRHLIQQKSRKIFSYIAITRHFHRQLKPLNLDIKSLYNECIKHDVHRLEAEFHLAHDYEFWRTSKLSSAISAQIEFSKRLPPPIFPDKQSGTSPEFITQDYKDPYAYQRHRILSKLKLFGKWSQAIHFCKKWMSNQTSWNEWSEDTFRDPAYLWTHKAGAYLGQKKVYTAITVCTEGLENYPDHPELFEITFKAYLLNQDYYKAEQLIRSYRRNNKKRDLSSFSVNTNLYFNQLYQTTGLLHKLKSDKEAQNKFPSPHQSDYFLQKLKLAYQGMLNNEFKEASLTLKKITMEAYARISIVKVIQGSSWPAQWTPRHNPPFFQMLHHLMMDARRSSSDARKKWLLQGMETYRMFNDWDEIAIRQNRLLEIKSKTQLPLEIELPEEARINQLATISTETSMLALQAGRSLIDQAYVFNLDNWQNQITETKKNVWLKMMLNSFKLEAIPIIPSSKTRRDTAFTAFAALSQWPQLSDQDIIQACKSVREKVIFSQDLISSFKAVSSLELSNEKKKAILRHWILAYVALKCELPELCESICLKMIKSHPDMQVHYNLLCESYLRQNQSLTGVFRNLKQTQSSSIGSYLKARHYVAMGEHVKATEQYRQLLVSEPENPHLEFALAQQWLELNAKSKAIEIFKKLMKESSPYRHLATYRYSHDRLASGEADYDKIGKIAKDALRSFPEDPLLLEILGRVYHLQAKYENALKTLLQALPKLKNRARIHYYLGETYWEKDSSVYKLWSIAHLEQASRAMVLNPDSAAARDLVVKLKRAPQQENQQDG